MWAVMPTSAAPAASSSGTPGGIGKNQSSAAQTNSAQVPCRPSKPWFDAQTRSPTLNRLTPAPTASTTPATSLPVMNGIGSFIATAPERM